MATNEQPPTGEPHYTAAEPLHPLALIQQAIAKGVDADYMGKLMDLQERYQRNVAAQAYSEAMNACQTQMPAILKDKKNTHTGNRYASWESLNALIRPVYAKHGFSLTFTENPDKSTAEGLWMICYCRHADGHVETVQGIFPRDGIGAKGGQIAMNALQAIGSTRSYAKRYLSKDLFALAEADEDIDGNDPAPTIKADQADILEKLIKTGYADGGLKFLDWMEKSIGVKSVTQIPAEKYQFIFDVLTKAQPKKKQQTREAGEEG